MDQFRRANLGLRAIFLEETIFSLYVVNMAGQLTK